MTPEVAHQADIEFDNWLRSVSALTLGTVLKDYVTGQTIDLNWEGWTRQEKSVIRKFFRDYRDAVLAS